MRNQEKIKSLEEELSYSENIYKVKIDEMKKSYDNEFGKLKTQCTQLSKENEEQVVVEK